MFTCLCRRCRTRAKQSWQQCSWPQRESPGLHRTNNTEITQPTGPTPSAPAAGTSAARVTKTRSMSGEDADQTRGLIAPIDRSSKLIASANDNSTCFTCLTTEAWFPQASQPVAEDTVGQAQDDLGQTISSYKHEPFGTLVYLYAANTLNGCDGCCSWYLTKTSPDLCMLTR